MRHSLAAIAGLTLLGQTAAPPTATIADLGWLSGSWVAGDATRWTEEHWSGPRGGAMLGYSRSGRGETLSEWEFIRIAPGADGVLAYQAQPGGRPAVAFRLVACDGTGATFENPDHDFPQRIRYVRDGGTMTATISAIDGSRAMSWTFRRQ